MAVKKKAFTESFDCLARVHCETCRKSPEWRVKVGAPEKCSDAFTPSLVTDTFVGKANIRQKKRNNKCGGCGLSKEEKARLRAVKEEIRNA